MRSNGKGYRQLLAAPDRCKIDGAQVARRVEVDAGLVRAAQHDAAHTGVGDPVSRIDAVIYRRGDIGRAIIGMLQVSGHFGEISVRAREYDFLHRGFILLQFDQFGFELEAALDLGEEFVGRDAERLGEATAAGGHVADERDAGIAGLLEPDSLRISVQELCDF